MTPLPHAASAASIVQANLSCCEQESRSPTRQALLRHRLPRQAHGFEGFGTVDVVVMRMTFPSRTLHIWADLTVIGTSPFAPTNRCHQSTSTPSPTSATSSTPASKLSQLARHSSTRKLRTSS